MEYNSIDEIFGTEEFIQDMMKAKETQGNYDNQKASQKPGVYLSNQANKLYLTITDMQTKETKLYVINPYELSSKFKSESYDKDNKVKKLNTDTNYKMSA